MPEHVCGVFDHVKQAGRCLCCAQDCYEVREVWTEGPLTGHPRRLGPQLDHATQVTFVLTDGSQADVTFCDDCARALEPAHYRALWLRIVERQDLSLTIAGRGDNDRRLSRTALLEKYPVGVVGRRREVGDGQLGVDRRG